jgi:hypothetical protein
MTECSQSSFDFQGLFSRGVVGRFDGGQITSDGGALLLREVESRIRIVERFAECFRDHRSPERIEHSVNELVAQRIYGLALGYEDLNDHDQLRSDPLMAVVAGKRDPEGAGRRKPRDRGKALAGKSTLNRLELTKADAGREDRYAKIVMDPEAIDRLLVDVFLEAHREAPEEIVLDLDATDDPLYGKQEGRFFHGYYGHYCYLPLYIFCGEHLLCARLRSSNIDASAGSKEEVERIVTRIRQRWPEVRIILRADSGFCREELMGWCDGHQVDYVIGLARNARLRSGSMRRWRKPKTCTGNPNSQPESSASSLIERTIPGAGRGVRLPKPSIWTKARIPASWSHLWIRNAGPRVPLRTTLLRARGDGKQDQRAVHVVHRPDQHGAHAVESTAALSLLGRLSADAWFAAAGTTRHRAGQSSMRDHPAQAAQNRRPRSHHRAQGLDLIFQRVRRTDAIPADPSTAQILIPLHSRSLTTSASLPGSTL